MNILEHESALEASGFERAQARAILGAISSGDENAFTKRDGKMLEVSLRSDMEKMEAGIRSDMEKMETGIRYDMQELRGDMQKMEVRLDGKIDNALLSVKLHMWVVAGALLASMVALQRLGLFSVA